MSATSQRPVPGVDRGPICECEDADCLEHLPVGAWDDIASRPPSRRILVVRDGHVASDRVIAFRHGWTLVQAAA